MAKKRAKKAVVAGVIIAELAVLDYAAWMVMRNGIAVEISQEELTEARSAAMHDMSEEGE